MDEVEKKIYAVEPFLDKTSREKFRSELQMFQDFCDGLVQSKSGHDSDAKKAADSKFARFRETFRELLYSPLFESA